MDNKVCTNAYTGERYSEDEVLDKMDELIGKPCISCGDESDAIFTYEPSDNTKKRLNMHPNRVFSFAICKKCGYSGDADKIITSLVERGEV